MKTSSERRKELVMGVAAGSIALILSLFFADRVLWALGLPAPAQLNPPDYTEVRKNIEFGQYEFKTNSLGFRYKEIPVRKPKGIFRVYMAGDSFTEGLGVPADETLSANLERRVEGIEFINGGLAGAGPDVYGNVFIKVGTKYRPDGLLICLYANDLADSWKEPAGGNHALTKAVYRLFPNLGEGWARLRAGAPQAEKAEHGQIVEKIAAEAARKGIDPKRIDEWKASLSPELAAAADRGEFDGGILSTGLLYPRRMTDSLDIDTADAEARWGRMTESLSRMVREARRRRIEPALIFFPSELQYAPEIQNPSNPWISSGMFVRREWLTEETALQKRLRAWAGKNGVPFLDITTAMRQYSSQGLKLNYPMDGHWNSEGTRAVSALIAEWLGTGKAFDFIHSKEPYDA